MSRPKPLILLFASVFIAFSCLATAQVPDPVLAASAPQPGSEHSYIGMGAETVNPADGQVSFDLPIHTPAGRELSFPFGIRYSFQELYHLTIPAPDNTGIFQWTAQGGASGLYGWSYDVPYLAAQELATQVWTTYTNPGGNSPTYTQHQCDGASNFVFRGFDGRQYTLLLGAGSWNDEAYQGSNPEDCLSPFNYSTSNIHGILATYPPTYAGWPLFPTVTVVDQSGTTYQFSNLGGYYTTINPNAPFAFGSMAQTITDRNGNQIVLNGNGYKDTLGRTVISWDNSIGSKTPNHVTVSGLGSNITVKWSSTPVGANYPMSGYEQSGSANCTVPTTGPPAGTVGINEIDYPNGQSYKFAYNSTYGTISQITFPDGGSVRYSWGLNHSGGTAFGSWWFNDNGYQTQYNCNIAYDVPVVTDRWVNDGQSDVLHQVFSYCESWVAGCSSAYFKTTTVTSHDLVSGLTSSTQYNYGVGCPDQVPFGSGCTTASNIPLDMKIVYEDGSGNTLQTQYKEWLDAYAVDGSQTVLDNGQTMTELRCLDTNEQVTNLYEYGFPSEGSYPGDPAPNNFNCGTKLGVSGTGGSIGPLRRQTVTAYHNFMGGTPSTHIVDEPDGVTVLDGSGTQVKQTTYAYDGSAVTASGAQTGLVTPPGLRGNTTSITQWLNGSSAPVTTYKYYDTGQVYTKTDPCGNGSCTDIPTVNSTTACDGTSVSGHTTSYCYKDSYVSGTGTAPGQTNAYLTTVTYPNTGAAHSEGFTWGYADGQIRSHAAQNGQSTSFQYGTPMGRLTEIDYPDSGKTAITYNDSTYTPANYTPSYTATQTINSSTSKVTTTAFDGFGHKVASLLTSDPDGETYTPAAYDGFGRTRLAYNPTRCGTPTTNCGESTWGYSTTSYDAIGRVSSIVKQDGSTVSYGYSGQCTTVTDETGKKRESCTDGLGRLSEVFEDPSGLNFETDYTYDTLDNLLTVTQKGGTTDSTKWRPRTFSYDALSRLITASNPESGTIQYSYDLNGNLATKTAPSPNTTQSGNSVTTHYNYDALNRLSWKTYTDTYSNPPTPAAVYGYDGTALTSTQSALCVQQPPTITPSPNLVGLRSVMCSGSSASAWSYDVMGRPLSDVRINASTGYPTQFGVGYTYNLDGSLAALTYPSGDVVTYTAGAAGRTTALSDSTYIYVGGSSTNRATYAPHGALASMVNGYTSSFAGITTLNVYNDRLQPISQSATVSGGSTIFSLCYDFHLHVAINNSPCSFAAYSTGNNGNVFQIVNNVDSTRSSAYLYDSLNRIAQAYTLNLTSANCWGETYSATATAHGVLPTTSGIDSWGNLLNRSGVTDMGACKTELFSTTASTQNQLLGVYRYDLAGNMTNDGNGNVPTYDGENRIITDASVTYSYDADGVRVQKSSGTKYWFGPDGQVLSEANLSGSIFWEYVYFNGQRIARVNRPGGTMQYFFNDHLGSNSVISGAVGVVRQQKDYFPFGGVSYVSGSDANPFLYTGKERDAESNLDYFGTRHYASSMGRWMTPDPLNLTSARLVNPTNTLNKYVYGANNPLKYIDKDGEDITIFYRPSGLSPTDFGHIFIGALNQNTGQVGFLDYYPQGRGNGPGQFNLGNMQDRAAQSDQFATLTIRTSPEQAQKVLDLIKSLTDGKPPDYAALSNNCTTICEDVLHDLGLDFGDIFPDNYWAHVYGNFAPEAQDNPFKNFFVPRKTGVEYGNPRNFGITTPFSQWLFQLYLNQQQKQQPKACVEAHDSSGQGTGTVCQ